jgi:hypothetical protein
MKLNFNLDSDHLDHGTMSTIDEAVVEDIVSAAKRQSVKTLLSGDNITSYSWKIAVEANVTIPFPAGLTEENWMSKLSEESKKHLAELDPPRVTLAEFKTLRAWQVEQMETRGSHPCFDCDTVAHELGME